MSIAAQNVIFVGLAAWAALLWRERRFPALPAPMGAYGLFVLWALAASLLSENAAHSMVTWRKWLLAAAAIYAADVLATRRSLQAVQGALLFFSGLTALGACAWALSGPWQALAAGRPWGEIATFWIQDTAWRARAGSGGYQVLATNCALLLSYFGALALSEPRWRRPLPLACLAALALAPLLSMTRGAWLATGLSVGLLLAFKRPAWLAGLAALALALALAFPNSVFFQRFKSSFDPYHDSNFERGIMWRSGRELVKEKPWLGVGDALHSYDKGGVRMQGAFLRKLSPEDAQWYERKGVAGKEQGHLHSNFIQLAVMYGLPGLALMLVFFARLFRGAWSAARARLEDRGRGAALGLCAALCAWWANGAFEYNFGSQQSSFVLWFLIGLYFASRRAAPGLGGAPV